MNFSGGRHAIRFKSSPNQSIGMRAFLYYHCRNTVLIQKYSFHKQLQISLFVLI